MQLRGGSKFVYAISYLLLNIFSQLRYNSGADSLCSDKVKGHGDELPVKWLISNKFSHVSQCYYWNEADKLDYCTVFVKKTRTDLILSNVVS